MEDSVRIAREGDITPAEVNPKVRHIRKGNGYYLVVE